MNSKERSNFILNSVKDEFTCQASMYWASKYVEDSFRNDYHYTKNSQGQQPHENDWFTVNITRPNSKPGQIYVINISSFNSELSEIKVATFLENNRSELHSFLFHGTNHDHAVSIINNNILLGMGSETQDFSHGKGFYLAEEYKFAKQSSRKETKPSVIVYKVHRNLLNADQNKGLDLYTRPREWKEIIKYFRSGKEDHLTPSINIKSLNFIRGEMCCNPFSGDEPEPFPGDPRIQLCIKKTFFGKKLGSIENILCVIFYNSRN